MAFAGVGRLGNSLALGILLQAWPGQVCSQLGEAGCQGCGRGYPFSTCCSGLWPRAALDGRCQGGNDQPLPKLSAPGTGRRQPAQYPCFRSSCCLLQRMRCCDRSQPWPVPALGHGDQVGAELKRRQAGGREGSLPGAQGCGHLPPRAPRTGGGSHWGEVAAPAADGILYSAAPTLSGGLPPHCTTEPSQAPAR